MKCTLTDITIRNMSKDLARYTKEETRLRYTLDQRDKSNFNLVDYKNKIKNLNFFQRLIFLFNPNRYKYGRAEKM